MNVQRGRFGDIIDGPHGSALWDFLNRADNIIRMETATLLDCVAVEPLGPLLLREFSPGVARADRFKQAVGFFAKQVLEGRGFRVHRSHCRIPREGLFSSGTRYEHTAK